MADGDYNVSFSSDTDIEEIKKLEYTLNYTRDEMAKTDELRRDLMANVSHDLKTPLTMIKAYAEMVRDLTYSDPEKRNNNLNVIIEESNRLNILVNDILTLSSLQSNTQELELKEFDLDEVIKTTLKSYEILADTEGYNFIYTGISHSQVFADKKRIEQVIYNMINNAINYTGPDLKIIINVIDQKDTYRVTITDTGAGINKKDLAMIWNKYYHTEKKHKRNTVGTGLGLSIIKSILDQHKFKYGVESKKNDGNTFYFDIKKSN